MSINFGIVLIIISLIQFGYAGYFFYNSKKELKGLNKLTKNDMPRRWSMRPEIGVGDNFTEVTKKFNMYIDDIKKTNRNINSGSGIVTIFSAVATLISGIFLIIIK